MNKFKIIWSKKATSALKTIFDFYKDKSLQGANNVKKDLLKSPKTIHFVNQYQADEIDSDFRRIIVRDYKVLYYEEKGIIYIANIICTKEA